MKESIEIFGSQNNLCGTLCVPDDIPLKAGKPCIIILNSGLVYQAGSNRLHVDMARNIAELDFCSFRFDLSGIGDSSRSQKNLTYDEQILADIDDALAFIEEKTGISSFVLMGICTGADNTHKFALTNSKITGTIFLDGYAYKTPGYYIRYYLPRILNPIIVANKLGRVISAFLKPTGTAAESGQAEEKVEEVSFWVIPPKEKTVKELKQLVDRNVLQLHIYTFDWIWCFNHQSQFNSMYKEIDFKGSATCAYFEQSDHVYTMIDDRLKLIKTVSHWLESNFQPSS
ncbi:MAG: hypothetical protein QNL62_19910 [Gammaproteobacteria bacterium]|nr:hypothetical protein [Gammaproteobacteria bacterium]